MRITKSLTLEICDELGVYRELERDSYEYNGVLALAKKGREEQQANTKFQQQQAQNLANQGNQQYGILNNLEGQEIASTTPGSLSPAAQAMFASDLSNINGVYNGLRQNAFASSGARGFGSAPSGFQQTSINALNQNQANAQTGAYRNAQINTERQRENVLNVASGARNSSIGGETGNTNAATQSAFDQSRMGSTLGDVLAASSSILGGISGVGGFLKGLGGFGGGKNSYAGSSGPNESGAWYG